MNRRTALKGLAVTPIAFMAACRDMPTNPQNDIWDFTGQVRQGQKNLLQSMQADLQIGTKTTNTPGLFVEYVNGQKDDWIIFLDGRPIFDAVNFNSVEPGMSWRVAPKARL